jgi:outer membrane receptor protein involved in Fe transport
MTFKKTTLASLVAWILFTPISQGQQTPDTVIDDSEVERIVVRGALTDTALSEMASSLTVLTDADLAQRQSQHLEDILNRAANVNFASGASRGRFIQIRGIGERSQFTDPINPSVGYLVDGINYSGLLAGASTFDIEQVEIFKGPNSARFGADGLAGMINVLSKDPSEQSSFAAQVGLANYSSFNLGAAVGGALTDDSQYRLSVHQNSSDGFVTNKWLGLDDTNGIDERTARGKLFWQLSEELVIKTVVHLIDVDNGYDTFSLDRDRSTLADEPGFDKQQSQALGVTAEYQGLDWANVRLQASYMQADLAYGYDEDWSYVGIAPGWEYSSTDHYFRERQDSSLEAKFSSKNTQGNTWVVGLYYSDRKEDLNRQFFDFDLWQDGTFDSSTDRLDLAIFGQFKYLLSDNQWLTTSLRLASQDLDYDDSRLIDRSIKHNDWGAEISYHQNVSDNTMLYLSLLRSYKMGGVNGQALGKINDVGLETFRQALLNNAEFGAESLLGVELGLKGANGDGSLTVDFNLFYQDRDEIQFKNSIVQDQSFVDFYNNAAQGSNYGLEVSVNYYVSSAMSLFSNIGYLRTEIQGITRQDGSTINKREQAHAPRYHVNAGVNWQLTEELAWLLEIDAKDDYFYSFSHDQRSTDFVIAHTSFTYERNNWQISLYARNLFDKQYANRGFYFGNDPRDQYVTHLYEQFGEPRRVGVNLHYQY